MTQITATSDGVGVRAGGSYVAKHVSGSPTFTLQVDLGIGWNNLKDSAGSDIQVTSSATYVEGIFNGDCNVRWELTSGTGTIDHNINLDGKT
jgi:hypothetical protein